MEKTESAELGGKKRKKSVDVGGNGRQSVEVDMKGKWSVEVGGNKRQSIEVVGKRSVR